MTSTLLAVILFPLLTYAGLVLYFFVGGMQK